MKTDLWKIVHLSIWIDHLVQCAVHHLAPCPAYWFKIYVNHLNIEDDPMFSVTIMKMWQR